MDKTMLNDWTEDMIVVETEADTQEKAVENAKGWVVKNVKQEVELVDEHRGIYPSEDYLLTFTVRFRKV